MLSKLFTKEKNSNEEWVAPLSGKLVDIKEVPDPTFSKKMMGDGLAIIPNKGNLLSPVNGQIIQVFPTKHAIGIKSDSGVEILIHIGLETVSLEGKPFDVHVKANDIIKVGQLLVSFDLNEISSNALSTITPIIITNGDYISNLEKKSSSEVIAGETVVASYQIKK